MKPAHRTVVLGRVRGGSGVLLLGLDLGQAGGLEAPEGALDLALVVQAIVDGQPLSLKREHFGVEMEFLPIPEKVGGHGRLDPSHAASVLASVRLDAGQPFAQLALPGMQAANLLSQTRALGGLTSVGQLQARDPGLRRCQTGGQVFERFVHTALEAGLCCCC